MREKEVIEFIFGCDTCGTRIKTRSDSHDSVKGCPTNGCRGRMLYQTSRVLTARELEISVLTGAASQSNSGRMVPL